MSKAVAASIVADAEWFGRPLRLKKGIYGQHFLGKYWSLDFTEWLISQGFQQSTADTTYLIKYHANGAWLRLIFYVDDCLWALRVVHLFGTNLPSSLYLFQYFDI